MTQSTFFLSAVLSLTLAMTALAGERIVIADFSSVTNPSGVPPGWKLKEKSGKAEFAVVRDDDVFALRLTSVDSSFSFQKEVNVDVRTYPLLTWKWKVTKLPAGGDFRASKTDDQAAQLFVGFTRTKVIVYIWDTSAPQGLMEEAPSPPFMHIKAVVVRSGSADTGKWLSETRNVYEDYKKLFGAEPPPVTGFRLQINSQHTETEAESFIADVMFKKQ